MIYGIGTDICDIRRIEDTLARRGDRFAEKVLGPQELAVFRARRARTPVRGPPPVGAGCSLPHIHIYNICSMNAVC